MSLRTRCLAMLTAAAVTALTAAPVVAAAKAVVPGHHASRHRPAAGAWTSTKPSSDGIEKKASWHLANGSKAIRRFGLTPTGGCAGARLSVHGVMKIKKTGKGRHTSYYVGETPSSSTPVTVTDGSTTATAGLIVDFDGARHASVVLSGGTGFCTFTFSMKR